MSYPSYSSSITDDISIRKEYAIFADVQKNKNPTEIDRIQEEENSLELNTYQAFIRNYFNPHTKFNTLYLVHGTGTGKTITSLSAIYEYIKFSKKSNMSDLNHVIIIGFTKNIFKRELLTYPEFGFLTKEEIQEYMYTEEQAKKEYPDAIKYLNELKIKYSRRLFNRKIGGVFKFYGYKELLMKLLDFSKIIKKGIRLSNVRGTDIRNFLASGEVTINEPMMRLFAHSLVVCDEVHNVYNSFYTNNWGTVLELVMDYYNDPTKKDHDPHFNSVRIMYLSATPLSNSPIELVSIINLLNVKEDRVQVEDLFDSSGMFVADALPKIRSLLYGKISYVMDSDPTDYPSSAFIGESIQHIHYLKFIRCPMSPIHKKTYIQLSKDQLEGKDTIGTFHTNDTSSEYSESILITKEMRKYPVNLALHNRYLNDYVLPHPHDTDHGIFLGNDLEKIHTAPKKWKDTYGVYTEIDSFRQYNFSGSFLLESNIKHYSTKYHKMLLTIKDIVLHKHGKIFIYHHFVNNSGVMFIQSILRENGYILNEEEPISSTKCVYCYQSLQEHKKEKSHTFKPLRFTIVTGNLTKSQVYKNLDAFNSSSNIDGSSLKIIIGSKAIKESYNIRGIQHVMIMHSPDNISDLIQVIGRAIRKKSHIDLPFLQRHTSIYIFVSSLEKVMEKKYYYTFEEARYKSKINIYKTIQKIENIFYDLSVDYFVNFMINKREIPKLIGRTFPMKEEEYRRYKKKIYGHALNTSTFYSYFMEDEMNTIQSIIKRLFIEFQPIFTYEDLWLYVRHPPFHVNQNTSLFSESSFILTLDSLLYRKNNTTTVSKKDSLLETTNRTMLGYLYNRISAVFMGLDGIQYNIINTNNLFLRIPSEIISSSSRTSDIPFRSITVPTITNISLNTLIQENQIVYQFDSILQQIIQKYSEKTITIEEIIQTYSFQFNVFLIEHTIEKIIQYIVFTKSIEKSILPFYVDVLQTYQSMHYTFYYDMITHKDIIHYNKEYIQKHKYVKSSPTTLTIELLNTLHSSKKIDSFFIPIGHFLKNTHCIYHIATKQWKKIPSIFKKIEYTQNTLLTGYDIKMNDSMNIDFKMQVHHGKQQGEGSKGLVCAFNSKSTLKQICKLLKIDTADQKQITKKNEICALIRNRLIELDQKERDKQSTIKYFYNFYEHL